MAISDETYREAIGRLSVIESVAFDPASLAEDIFLLGIAYSEEETFAMVVASTIRALRQIVSGRVTVSMLKYEFEGLSSYHFQAARAQGSPADMRIVFRREEGCVRVVGFGNRRIPSDIYQRLSSARRILSF